MKSLGVLLICITLSAQLQAQDEKQDKAAAVKQLVESKNYQFVAETMLPQRGRVRPLTFGYDMIVSPDTLSANLPFFGRAFTAPIGSTDGGIQFTTTEFDYTIVPKDKGGWDITIKPKNAKDVRQMLLNITESGYASLRVINLNRDPISFNGYIKERPKK